VSFGLMQINRVGGCCPQNGQNLFQCSAGCSAGTYSMERNQGGDVERGNLVARRKLLF